MPQFAFFNSYDFFEEQYNDLIPVNPLHQFVHIVSTGNSAADNLSEIGLRTGGIIPILFGAIYGLRDCQEVE